MAGSGRQSADELLALALAQGWSIGEAARSANISERTAFRRLADPQFVKRVQELRARMVSEASGRLVRTMSEATAVLADLLSNPDARIRLTAAKTIIESALKVNETVELETRITELEKQFKMQGTTP